MNPRTAQNYENHRSIDYVITLVWPILLCAALLAVAAAIFHRHAALLFGMALFLLVLANFVMTFKIRAYSLKMQDRIIRLEMRLRLQKLLPVDRHWEINGLSMSQLIALRRRRGTAPAHAQSS
jgi:hypothetical protein